MRIRFPANEGDFPLSAAILILIFITLIVYFPVLSHDFANWDDPKHIKVIWEPSWLRAYLIVTDTDLSFTGVKYFNPVHFLSLMLDQVFNSGLLPDPTISKTVNALFHTCNAVLVFFLCMNLGISRRGALFAALLFALHPLQVGTTAWISERKNLLVCFFYLSAMFTYMRFLKTDSLISAISTFLLFVLGLASKPLMITFPFAMLSYHLLFNASYPKFSIRNAFLQFFLLIGAILWALYVTSTEVAVPDMPPYIVRPFLAAGTFFFYLLKILFPHNLVPIYPKWNVEDDLIFYAFLLSLILIATVFLARSIKKIDRVILFAVSFFVLNWLPISGLISFGHFSHSYVADHLIYVPLVGFSLIVGRTWDLITEVCRNGVKTTIMVAMYLLIGCLGLLSIKQTILWRDPVSMWEANLQVNTASPAVYSNYGAVLASKGEFDKATEVIKEAIRLVPNLDLAYLNLGETYLKSGNKSAAKKAFQNALGLNQAEPTNYVRLASLLRSEGETQAALDLLEIACEKFPESSAVLNELGLLYNTESIPDKALIYFQRAVASDQFNVDAYLNAAVLLQAQGRLTEAKVILQSALDKSSDPRLLRTAGLLYRSSGDLIQSKDIFQRLFSNYPEASIYRDEYVRSLILLKKCDEAEFAGRNFDESLRIEIERCKAAR